MMIWRVLPALMLAAALAACSDPDVPAGPGQHAVATAHPLATEAALEVLADGGNAFDAAVTASAVLAVVEPFGSGMGGGGFWLLHRAADGHEVMIDGRETAPGAAHADMYLDADGEVDERASLDGALAAAIPGQPAALEHLAGEYGELPLARLLEPAIRLAQDGFEVDQRLAERLGWRQEVIAGSPAAAAVFLPDGEPLSAGQTLRQRDLARTLQAIADDGSSAFYDGDIARKMVEAVQEAGGIWSLDDLAGYRIVEREPVTAEAMGLRIVAASPPSSGGVTLVQTLNILEELDIAASETVERVHLIAEAMRRAYRDRARYLGDPDHVDMPLERLLSKDYAAGQRTSIRRDRALPSEYLAPVMSSEDGGPSTTHFSIMDAHGNRVAATLSINWPFGSGFMPEGTGILLNNEMDDFAARPGEPNVYGLVHSQANAIAPGKRMLSSMTPAFFEQGERVAVVGTPGGSRIISMVLLAALEFAADGDAEAMVSTPRFHHQYLPDRIQYEPGALPADVRERLRALGHEVDAVGREYGDMHVITRDGSEPPRAASDPRGSGLGEVRQK